jgi:UDP-hydrolysing UDP-N-acetyl-D-glucosamine 2-epimerase
VSASTGPARKIAVLSVGRSDFGRYLPMLRVLREDPAVELRLLVRGAHFSTRFGETWREIAAAGFTFETDSDPVPDAVGPAAVGASIAYDTAALAKAFARDRPDLLVVLGDRFEMLAGPCAALGFNIPVVHIHGGAVTEGAIDELVRHALTKMSHLHLVSLDQYGARVRQMGEEPWRVITVGAPGLDDLRKSATLTQQEVSAWIGLDLGKPTLLVSFHPVTLEADRTWEQVAALADALEQSACQAVLTYPNADHGHEIIIDAFEALAAAHPQRFRIVRNASTYYYTNLLNTVNIMVGNSSGGLVEAPTFRLPVVNIGTRQDGKLKPANVIDVDYSANDILAGINMARSAAFRAALANLVNPYGDGRSGPRIAQILKTIPLDDHLLRKRFVDL